MRLTLLKAKEYLKGKAPSDKLEYRLNRACERLMTSGKYNGSLHRLALVAPYGQVALPRHYRTIEGVKDSNGVVYDITNHWFEFLPGHAGMGGFTMNNVRDIGDGHATIRDLPSGGTLTLDYPGSTPNELNIYGTDAFGMPQELKFASKSTVSNPFARIDRIEKQQGSVVITLTHTNPTTGIITPLAMMSPKEEEAFYRRYMIDRYAEVADAVIIALCKLRHIEFTDDKDVLPFANISALELALDALQYEAENDHAVADAYWNKAIKVLNDELGDTNAATTIPAIRFIYPGNTAPHFRSPM